MVDPVLLAIVAILLGFFFFIYLMIRRTFTQFQKGMQQGQREDRKG